MRPEAHLLRFKQTPLYIKYELCYVRFIRLINIPRIKVRFQQVKSRSGIEGNEGEGNDNKIAELEEASEAMCIAIQLGMSQLLVITDSEDVVKLYEKTTRQPESHLHQFKQTPLYLK